MLAAITSAVRSDRSVSVMNQRINGQRNQFSLLAGSVTSSDNTVRGCNEASPPLEI